MHSTSNIDMWQTLLKQQNVNIIRKLYMKTIMTIKPSTILQIHCYLENPIHQYQISSLCDF